METRQDIRVKDTDSAGVGLTIILALHAGHDLLHEIVTGNSEFLEVQELADGGGRGFGVVLCDHENGCRDGRLGCLGLEEELQREGLAWFGVRRVKIKVCVEKSFLA